jgi:glutaminyl-peptide cyclotransferase
MRICAGSLLIIFLPLFNCSGISERKGTEFSGRRAFDHLIAQCDFGPRYPGSPGHKLAEGYLSSELGRWCDEIHLQRFKARTSSGKELELVNIIGVINPRRPIIGKAKTILICAHWDTRPFAEMEKNSKETPILGANDGASGVAVLLELARVLSSSRPKARVLFALFDGEDYGMDTRDMFLGSRYFAKKFWKYKPDLGILLDMVGDKDLDIYIEENSWAAAPELVDLVWGVAEELGISAFHRSVKYRIIDDHIPLIEAGVKCIDVIDFDYPHWHTTRDTPDKCSPDSLKAIGDVVLKAIRRIGAEK